MKNLLLASTVLVGTAGFAFAEVTVSGDARMGVTYDDAKIDNELAFDSRARVVFTMAGETDGGLTFGATLRADNSSAAASGTAGSVFLSGAFGKLSMGDVSSAAENAVGDLVGVGYVGVGDGNEMTYLASSDTEIALYTYSAGSLSVMASLGQPDNTGPAPDETTMSVAGAYSTDEFSVALGYEDVGTADHIIGGATVTMSGITVEGIYGTSSDLKLDQYGVGVSYSVDALTLAAYYRVADTAGTKKDFFGVGGAYDLGGGATLAGGVADIDGSLKGDLGINFTF